MAYIVMSYTVVAQISATGRPASKVSDRAITIPDHNFIGGAIANMSRPP